MTTVDGIPLQFRHVLGRDLGVPPVIAKAGSCDVWAGIGPQPSFYERRALALICDRLPSEYAETAGRILAEDVHANAPNAPESSRVLAALTERGLFDGMPVIVEALLAGDRLPVSVAAWLPDASVGVRRQLVDEALDGNQIALAEVAAADLAADDPKLREACDRVIRRLVR